MKFSLKSLIIWPILLSVAALGILHPMLERQQAKEILTQCNGVFKLRELESGEPPNFEYQFLETYLGARYRTHFKAALIAPIASQGELLRAFLSKHTGMVGLDTLTILSNSEINASAYYPVSGLDDIRFLKIKDATLDRRAIEAISRIEDLELLELLNCKFSPEDLPALRRNQHLAWLHIHVESMDLGKLNEARKQLPETYVTFGDFTPIMDSVRK